MRKSYTAVAAYFAILAAKMPSAQSRTFDITNFVDCICVPHINRTLSCTINRGYRKDVYVGSYALPSCGFEKADTLQPKGSSQLTDFPTGKCTDDSGIKAKRYLALSDHDDTSDDNTQLCSTDQFNTTSLNIFALPTPHFNLSFVIPSENSTYDEKNGTCGVSYIFPANNTLGL